MLILSRADVEALLTMPDAIESVAEAFRQLAIGNVAMPQRAATPIAPHNGLHLSMPAFVGGEQADDGAASPGALSIKVVTVYGDNPLRFGLPTIQGVLLLHDAATGRLLAMMDAEHLTAMRTGAASGVATRFLAKEDATTVTLFGAGAQAHAQLAAMCAVRRIQRVWVLTRTGRQDAAFCTRVREELQVEAISTRDSRSAVGAADIICTATNTATPLFDGAWLSPGVHINAIGAYKNTLRELDSTTLRRCRLFVDYHPAAKTEAGDVLLAIAEGAISYKHVAGQLGDLVAGQVPGRTDDEEITLFKSVGVAIQDTVTAAKVYAKAIVSGRGQEVHL